MDAKEKSKKKYTPKPYEKMQFPGQRNQIDVKVVLRNCSADPQLKLYQYNAIDEYSLYRILGAYSEQSTYSSADFLIKVTESFRKKGVKVECVQTDKGFEFTNSFSNSNRDIPTRLKMLLPLWAFGTSLFVHPPLVTPATLNILIVNIRNVSMMSDGSTVSRLTSYAPLNWLSLFLPCPRCLTNLHCPLLHFRKLHLYALCWREKSNVVLLIMAERVIMKMNALSAYMIALLHMRRKKYGCFQK